MEKVYVLLLVLRVRLCCVQSLNSPAIETVSEKRKRGEVKRREREKKEKKEGELKRTNITPNWDPPLHPSFPFLLRFLLLLSPPLLLLLLLLFLILFLIHKSLCTDLRAIRKFDREVHEALFH